MFNRVRTLFSRTQQPETGIQRVYTSGDQLYTEPELRSQMQREFMRQNTTGGGISESALTEAYRLVVAAYVCIEYHAATVASIPFGVEKPNGEPIEWHPFQTFESNYATLIENIDRSLSIWGKTYLQKKYNRDGYPTALEFVNPNNITEKTQGQFITGYRRTDTREDLSLEQVVLIRLFDPKGDGNPQSPLEVAFGQSNVSYNIISYAESFFRNSARPDGILSFEQTLTPEQFEDAKRVWKQNFQGSKNAHRTAVMPPGAKWTALNNAVPSDLAMTELNDQAKQEVCAAFNVPPALVGLGDTSDPLSAQSTLEATKRNFVQTVALRRVNMILAALTEQWTYCDFRPPNFYTLKSDPMQLSILSDVNADNTTIVSSNVQSGVWDYNEGREYLGYEPRVSTDDRLYIAAPPDTAQSLYEAGHITLNQSRMMLGLEKFAVDVIKIDGKTVPVSKMAVVAEANVKAIESAANNTGGFFGGRDDATITVEKPNVPQLPSGQYEAVASLPPRNDDADYTATSDQLDELRKWYDKARSRRRDIKFEADYLRDDVVAFIRSALDGDMPLQDVFDTAATLANTRAIQATRIEFEDAWEDLLIAAQTGQITDRRRFGILARSILDRWGREAYRDGLQDEGVIGEFSDEDDAEIRRMLTQQSAFISNLSAEIYRGNGLSAEDIATKPSLWYRGSIVPFYNAGLASAGANFMAEFAGDDGQESCPDCQRLKGQRHRYSVWKRNGLDMYPSSYIGQNTECNGWKCNHRLVRVQARARGRIRSEDIEHFQSHVETSE